MSELRNGASSVRLNRRRFIVTAACALAGPTRADDVPSSVHRWTGKALGAEVSVILCGASPLHAARSFAKLERVLLMVEEHFSLYRDSALTRLNRIGRLDHPPPAMRRLFGLAGEVHRATGGLFDPTIQPLWLAIAHAGDEEAARALVGWERVRVSDEEIVLEPGMQLTFNGIAQGHAADEVAGLLRAEGYSDVLIDTGEVAGLGVRPGGIPWLAAIAMPDGREVSRASLSDRALAVSSPMGTLVGGGRPHIVNPRGGAPLWALAAVSASSAALADALSTSFCLMPRPAIETALADFPEARLESLVSGIPD